MSEAVRGLVNRRLLRFLTVGIGAALLFFSLCWLFVSLGLSPFLGSVAAYAIAFVVAYLAQQGWTFEGRHGHGGALPRYLALQLGCAIFSGLLAYLAVEHLLLEPLMMSALTTLVTSAASYVLSLLWVFPDRTRA